MSENTETIKEESFKDRLIKSKSATEGYIVLSLYKNPELFFDNEISVDDFHSPIWKFYFAIVYKAIEQDKKAVDDITVDFIISDNKILQEKYQKYGGYKTISDGIGFVQEDNFESYLRDLKKINIIIKLHGLGFPIEEKFDKYKEMSVEKIQEVFEGLLSTVFADVAVDEKVEDLSDGLMKVVEDADKGVMRGFPLTSDLLNKAVNGMPLGNLYIMAGNSGIGKSFITISQILPNMIEFKEKLLILANEEDSVKFKQSIIVWAINNVIGGTFEKKRFNQGEFTKEEWEYLRKAIDWLNENMEKGVINFVNFNSFKMDKALKLIKKYATVHKVKYFIIDTLKLDSDALNESSQTWLQLQMAVSKLYDLIKPSNMNLFCWATFQLNKGAMSRRYLDQSTLGIAKNITDVASCLLLARRCTISELEGGKNELEVKTKDGKTVKLKKDKDYFIVFLGKNRMGETNRQIVLETDIGRGIIRDYGYCTIEQDY